MNRETVALALFNLLEAPMRTAGAVTVARRLLHWSDVQPPDQPAVFVAQGDSTPTQSTSGEPATWRMTFSVYIYVHELDPSATPATRLNLLLDALTVALAPVGFEKKQRLGGTVEHCWISGAIETDEGTLGDQAMAIVPLEVLYSQG